jgi:cardiolipin synthase
MTRFVDGNRITLLRCGAEFFPALEKAIDEARHEIYLQTYIFEDDESGLRIAEAFKRAAARNVKVCVLIDGFGSMGISKKFVRELREARVNVLFYRPKISPFSFKRSRLRRLHSKIAVMDGQVAFVGGINIIDDLNRPGGEGPRIDYAVEVRGPLVEDIFVQSRRLWRRIAWLQLRRRSVHFMPLPVIAPIPGGVRAAFVTRDNVLHRHDFEREYLKAIAHAKSDIVIANAYFLPGRRFRQALIAAAERGVKVKLLLQGRMEYVFLFATQSFYGSLLRCGIEIYEYQKSYMHSKVAVIDKQWATVGSSNLDPFSLLLAREANIIVQDKQFAEELCSDIHRTIKEGAERIRPENWKKQPVHKRFISWIMYEAIRIGLGMIGYTRMQ